MQECLSQIRALPFVGEATIGPVEPRDLPLVDFRLRVRPRDTIRIRSLPCAIQRSHLSNEMAQHFAALVTKVPDLTLFAPAVGRPAGDLFERAGVNFIDRAGNCSLRLDDRHVARVQGRRAPQGAPADRAMRAPSYRALLALLIQPELISAPVRAHAAAAFVSPQTAADLRKRLEERGLVVRSRTQRHWLPERRKEAIDLFLSGYSSTLAPTLLIGRYRAQDTDPNVLERRIEPLLDVACTWRYGGGAAAMRLTQYYRGDRTTLYLQDPPHDLANRLRFVPAWNGPIALMRTPTLVAFESPHPQCIHPLLAYADLLGEHDERAREAASELYDRYLAREGARR